MTGKYDKIIHLPHHTSTHRPRMTLYQRAAQFAPFAALDGHSDAIHETARLTDRKAEISECECDLLNRRLALLIAHIQEHPDICITYFVSDGHKEGGHYATHAGPVKSWDECHRAITFADGTRIPACEIKDISGRLFHTMPDNDRQWQE